MSKPKLRNTLLMLILVMTPPYFLIFTLEGNKISDSVVLWLFGQDTFDLNIKEMDSAFTQAQILEIYPDLTWQCDQRQSALGSALCVTNIGTFNGYPSRRVFFYFHNDQVTAVKILYRKTYHESILGHILQQLGQPENLVEALKDTPDTTEVLEWITMGGRVILKKEITDQDEPALLWLAPQS